MSCDPSSLDQLLCGELPADHARVVAEHADRCDQCRAELSALRAERTAFARLPLPAVSHLRRPVMQRCADIHQKRERRSQLSGALAFAASLALVVWASSGTGVDVESYELSSGPFCSVAPGAGTSAAPHCGGMELVAQAETEFRACLVASPGHDAEFGALSCDAL